MIALWKRSLLPKLFQFPDDLAPRIPAMHPCGLQVSPHTPSSRTHWRPGCRPPLSVWELWGLEEAVHLPGCHTSEASFFGACGLPFTSWVKFRSSVLNLKELRIIPGTRGTKKQVRSPHFLMSNALTKPECWWLRWPPPPGQVCSQVSPHQEPQQTSPVANVPLLKGSGQTSRSFWLF